MLAVQSDFCGCLDFPFNISQDINNGFFGDLLPFGMSKCFFGMFFLLFGSYLNALAASILKFLKSLPLKAK